MVLPITPRYSPTAATRLARPFLRTSRTASAALPTRPRRCWTANSALSTARSRTLLSLRVDKSPGLSGTGLFIWALDGRITPAQVHISIWLYLVFFSLGWSNTTPYVYAHRLAFLHRLSYTDSRLHLLSLRVVYCLHPYISLDLECVRLIPCCEASALSSPRNLERMCSFHSSRNRAWSTRRSSPAAPDASCSQVSRWLTPRPRPQ